MIQDLNGLNTAFQREIILSLVTIVGLWLLRQLTLRLVSPRLEDPKSRYRLGKSTAYVAYVLGALFLLEIWLETLGNLGTFLGLLTAGLAIALKDIVSNLAGWLFILARQPFSVGDRIEIGGQRGDVVDIRASASSSSPSWRSATGSMPTRARGGSSTSPTRRCSQSPWPTTRRSSRTSGTSFRSW
ncbi:MAG: mechanosensitive ion channel [Gemmatimonadota bacterium]